MRPIFLIGFMCSGKTTLGKALRAATGVDFVDLDLYIESQAGMSVREIFARHGEPHFRKLEHEALRSVAGLTDVVVACGGGTPCQPGAMDIMNAAGTTVYLQPSRERLIRRLMAGRHKRPLLAGIDTPDEMMRLVDTMLEQRNPYYSQAREKFDSTLLETDAEVSVSVDEFKRRFFN